MSCIIAGGLTFNPCSPFSFFLSSRRDFTRIGYFCFKKLLSFPTCIIGKSQSYLHYLIKGRRTGQTITLRPRLNVLTYSNALSVNRLILFHYIFSLAVRKRRRWSDDRDSQHLVARFDNRSPDGAITISNGTEHPVCCELT